MAASRLSASERRVVDAVRAAVAEQADKDFLRVSAAFNAGIRQVLAAAPATAAAPPRNAKDQRASARASALALKVARDEWVGAYMKRFDTAWPLPEHANPILVRVMGSFRSALRMRADYLHGQATKSGASLAEQEAAVKPVLDAIPGYGELSDALQEYFHTYLVIHKTHAEAMHRASKKSKDIAGKDAAVRGAVLTNDALDSLLPDHRFPFAPGERTAAAPLDIDAPGAPAPDHGGGKKGRRLAGAAADASHALSAASASAAAADMAEAKAKAKAKAAAEAAASGDYADADPDVAAAAAAGPSSAGAKRPRGSSVAPKATPAKKSRTKRDDDSSSSDSSDSGNENAARRLLGSPSFKKGKGAKGGKAGSGGA